MNSPSYVASAICAKLNRLDHDLDVTVPATIYLISGDFPNEQTIYNMEMHGTEPEATGYLKDNTKIVATIQKDINFSYDIKLKQRSIKLATEESFDIVLENDLILQSSQNKQDVAWDLEDDLFAVIVFDYFDATRNININERPIIVTPLVGRGYQNSIQINFDEAQLPLIKDEVVQFRTMSLDIFDSYQDVDTPLMALDPDRVGETDANGDPYLIQVGTKSTVYLNKHLTEFVSEAYRRNFSQNQLVKSGDTLDQTKGLLWKSSYNNGYFHFNSFFSDGLEVISDNELQQDFTYLINDSLKYILDLMNDKAREFNFPKYTELNPGQVGKEGTTLHAEVEDFVYIPANHINVLDKTDGGNSRYTEFKKLTDNLGLNMYFVVRAIFQNQSITLRNRMFERIQAVFGISQSIIDNAKKCIIPFKLDKTKWQTQFDKEQQLLTVVYPEPVKIPSAYQKSIHNPQNEGLHLYFQNGLNKHDYTGMDPVGDELLKLSPTETFAIGEHNFTVVKASGMQIFKHAEDVRNGVNNENTRFTTLNDFNTVSIGLNSDNKDVGLNTLEKINYIDKLTFVVDVPNKY